MKDLFDSPLTFVLLLLIIVLFGSKKLPDAARSVGRSIRIFKSELDAGAKEDQSGKADQSSSDDAK